MPAYRLLPFCKDYLWGGERLRQDFEIVSDLKPLAEAWILSCHPDGSSVFADGSYAGVSLPKYIQQVGRQVLGTRCAQFKDFPLMVKLIDARQPTSIQVHPPDQYALSYEGQSGKTEMWVILHAEPGAYLYYGLNRTISRDELVQRINDGSLIEVLRKMYVKSGDTIFIPAGTIHAIGAGLTVAEIQQNSNVTYRIFDYGRVGKNGMPRDLHVEQALSIATLEGTKTINFSPHLGLCRYFTVDRINAPLQGLLGSETFLFILTISGGGMLYCGKEQHILRPGSSFFLPAGSGYYWVEGSCKILYVYLSE